MPILLIKSRILLLLTMAQIIAVPGRLNPAAPLTASLRPTPQVELSDSTETFKRFERGAANWKHGQQYQERQCFRLFFSRKQVFHKVHVKLRDSSASIYGQRRLLIMGSAPPSCQGKCGPCVPCTPIHVSMGYRPGSLSQQEYYPEVWRCKCGDKTFLP